MLQGSFKADVTHTCTIIRLYSNEDSNNEDIVHNKSRTMHHVYCFSINNEELWQKWYTSDQSTSLRVNLFPISGIKKKNSGNRPSKPGPVWLAGEPFLSPPKLFASSGALPVATTWGVKVRDAWSKLCTSKHELKRERNSRATECKRKYLQPETVLVGVFYFEENLKLKQWHNRARGR